MACRWYEQHGYCIVARNVRVGKGEIDFIATRHEVVVIGEVKARASENFGSPAQAMSEHKQRTVRRAGVEWAKANNIALWQLRFDLVCIVGTRIEVLRDAF
jgi:putative endonuclease